jgi:hypothetical protein
MASFKFNKSENLTDDYFFMQFRIEVLKLIGDLNSVFSDKFDGVFEITVDPENPRSKYVKDSDEELDETLLKVRTLFLEKKMQKIADRISKRETHRF